MPFHFSFAIFAFHIALWFYETIGNRGFPLSLIFYLLSLIFYHTLNSTLFKYIVPKQNTPKKRGSERMDGRIYTLNVGRKSIGHVDCPPLHVRIDNVSELDTSTVQRILGRFEYPSCIILLVIEEGLWCRIPVPLAYRLFVDYGNNKFSVVSCLFNLMILPHPVDRSWYGTQTDACNARKLPHVQSLGIRRRTFISTL